VNRTQRLVFIAAFVFIACGIVFGFIHAWSVNHGTLLVLREQYKDGWLASTIQPSNPPDDPLSRAKQMNYRYVRVVDAHTHIIKLGTVLLLVGLVQPLVVLPLKRKRALAAMFIVGSCIFPSAVLAETSIKGPLPQIFAAFGALLVIVSFAGFLYGLMLGTSSQPIAPT